MGGATPALVLVPVPVPVPVLVLVLEQARPTAHTGTTLTIAAVRSAHSVRWYNICCAVLKHSGVAVTSKSTQQLLCFSKT